MGRGSADQILFGSGVPAVRRGARGDAGSRAEARGGGGAEAKTVRKDYSYRGGGAGSEECSLTEFAELHIQDWDTAMFEAERLLRWGETENDDDGEGVWEHYELIDRDGFIEQLRMILAESPDLADLAEFLGGRG